MQQHRVIPTVVEALENCKIVKIDSMSTYTLALDESGSVFVWGTGQCVASAYSSVSLFLFL